MMETSKFLNKRKELLNQIKEELNNRTKRWEAICSLPDFKTYAELRKNLESNKESLKKLLPRYEALKKQIEAIPDVNHSKPYLWVKMIKCKIKYKFNNKYKNLLAYEHAQNDFLNKKERAKLLMGEFYEIENRIEILKAVIKRIENSEIYKEINDIREAIKGGKTADLSELDFPLYADKPFDPKIYAFETLVRFKTRLQNEIEREEKIFN